MSYSGPGNIGELTGGVLEAWKATASAALRNGVSAALAEANGQQGVAYFYNAAEDSDSSGTTVDIAWTAFPKRLTTNNPDPIVAWQAGDSTRLAQEEYCEWTVVRDPSNPTRAKRMVFTTETPDYYQFLAQYDRSLLLRLYQTYVSPAVKIEDLILGGGYSVLNKWNHPGSNGMGGTIMHMGGNGANYLEAAIILSAQASWPSVDQNGQLITSEQALIRCRRFGAPARHSDPFIGAQINQLVRLQKQVSLSGPLGLYIDEIDFDAIELPNGINIEEVMTVERGDDDHMMRVSFEMPAGSGFDLSDAGIDGVPLQYGGQIAELMRIRITGVAKDAPNAAPQIPCDGAQSFFSPMTLTRMSANIA